MKLNVGSGSLRLEGFENVDIRRVGPGVRRGHAGALLFAPDASVEVLFSHAVFEHVYLAQRLAVLREWMRVLAPDGVVVCLGIPDFRAVAAAYLGGAPGIIGPSFDLFHVYRYTHGDPEMAGHVRWQTWDPARHVDSAPGGYLPQLHKGLFDAGHLASLLARVGLTGSLLHYAYPGEEPVINLGFVAGAGCDEHEVAERRLVEIPDVGRFVRLETVRWEKPEVPPSDRLADEVLRLEHEVPTDWRSRLHRRFG